MLVSLRVSFSFLQIQPVSPPHQMCTTGPTKRGRCPDSRNLIKAHAHTGTQINFERHCYLVLNHRIMLRHFQLDPQHSYLSRLRRSYRFASFNCIISFTEITFKFKFPTLVNIRTLILIQASEKLLNPNWNLYSIKCLFKKTQLFDYSRTSKEKDLKHKSVHDWQNPCVKQIYNN